MTESPIEQPSAELMRRIDEVCDRFERSWGTPRAVRIEELVCEFDGSQATLLKHLIRLELDLLDENAPSDPGRFYGIRFPAPDA